MTTCIAGICKYGDAIVLATDQAITYQEVTGDALALKIQSVHRNWGVMFAGDVGHIASIVRFAAESLDHQKDEPVERIEKAILDGYHKESTMRLNAQLAHLGFDLESFRKEGREKLGDHLFAEYCRQLKDAALGVSFLVAGFGEKGGADIIEVSDPVEKLNYRPLMFWAIGSGARMALQSLALHRFDYRIEIGDALYLVCEAKFITEECYGVGEKTSVLIMRRHPSGTDGGFKVEVREVTDRLLKQLRKKWQRYGVPRIPRGIKDLIENSLEDDNLMRRVLFT